MKIGKQIKRVKSPAREIRKVTKKEQPIPVKMPEKVPETAEWKFIGHVWGTGINNAKLYLSSVSS